MNDGDLYILESQFINQEYTSTNGNLFAIDCSNCVTLEI